MSIKRTRLTSDVSVNMETLNSRHVAASLLEEMKCRGAD